MEIDKLHGKKYLILIDREIGFYSNDQKTRIFFKIWCSILARTRMCSIIWCSSLLKLECARTSDARARSIPELFDARPPLDAWIGRVKWRRPYTSSRVFRGLLLYSSYAFSQIQSACQVRTILYFSANLVESRWGPLLTFYLSGNVYHSWYELFSFTSKHQWALSQHSIILNFFLLFKFARTLIMPLPSCSSSASSLALLLLRNEF